MHLVFISKLSAIFLEMSRSRSMLMAPYSIFRLFCERCCSEWPSQSLFMLSFFSFRLFFTFFIKKPWRSLIRLMFTVNCHFTF